MIKQYTLFLGLNDKIKKVQIINTLEAYKILMNLLSGATITESTGFYKHEDGTLVIEKSLQIQILDFDNNLNINKLIEDLKTLFNQESIAVFESMIESRLM